MNPSPPPVPDHELLRPIGRGSYGEVWLARNVLGEFRAVKIIRQDGRHDGRPFEREFDGLQKFEPISRSHEGLVHILHAGRFEGGFFYVMELADSVGGSEVPTPGSQEESQIPISPVRDLLNYSPRTLRSELQKRGRLPVADCIELALKLTDALAHLHGHGLVHRDIKPSNIIFVRGLPRLADVGLVASADASLTWVGTEGYLPPEGPGRPPADLFALGKVLYELSTGHDRNDFPELPTLLRDDPRRQELEDLNEVILRACDPDLRRRYQNSGQMRADLLLMQSGRSLRAAGVLRRRLVFARQAGALVGLFAVLAMAAFFYQQSQTGEAQRLAQAEMFQRTRAEAALNTLQWKQAEHYFDSDEANQGVAYLARMLRQNPSNHIAAARLLSALNDRSFALPIRVLMQGPDLSSADFSPDGRHVLLCSGSDMGGLARLWDTQSGAPVGHPMIHDSMVQQGRFSPDGQWIGTLTKGGVARVWNAATGEPVTEALRHKDSLGATYDPYVVSPRIQFSPDGQLLLTAHGSEVKLWKVPAGTLARPPINNLSAAQSVELSPDGGAIVTAGEDLVVRVWNVSTGELRHSLQHGDGPGPAFFSPNGRRILSSGGFHAETWDAETGIGLASLQPEALVFSATFSPDGLRVATAEAQGTATLWDSATGLRLLPPLRHSSEVNGVAFDPSGERLVSWEWQRARVWDSRTGKPMTEWILQPDRIRSAAFSPDGRNLLIVSGKNSAVLWDVSPGQALNVLLRHQMIIPSARFDRAGIRVVTASGGDVPYRSQSSWVNEVGVWDVRTGNRATPVIVSPVFGGGHGFQFAEFSPDGTMIATASERGEVGLWDAGTGTALRKTMWHDAHVRSVRFSHDNRKVVSASDDKTVKLWDVKTGLQSGDPLSHSNGAKYSEFSPDNALVVSVMSATNALLWDARTNRKLDVEFRHEGEVNSARFNPDGRRIVTASQDGTARIWECPSGKLVSAPLTHQGEVFSAEFSPDGRYVATASLDQTARIWDASTGQPVAEPLKHRGVVYAARFSPDGRRVATASSDGSARIWDTLTGQPVTEPLRHSDWVVSAEFSPDGSRLLTASSDETARIWELMPAPVPVPSWLLDLAEAAAGSHLIEQELPEAVPATRLIELKAQTPESSEAGSYAAWARWFLTDRSDRTTSLTSSLTGIEYLTRLMHEIRGSFGMSGHDSLRMPRHAVHLAPNHALATAILAASVLGNDPHYYRHRDDEARFLLDRAIRLNHDEPLAWRLRALQAEREGRLEDALSAIQETTTLTPGDAEPWAAQGRLLERLGQDDAALDAHARAADLALKSGKNLVFGLWDLDAYAKEPELASSGGLGRSDVFRSAMLARSGILERSGRFAEAEANRLRALRLPPRSPDTPPALVDLSNHYDLSLDDNLILPNEAWGPNNLHALSAGVQRLAGVVFDVRGIVRVGVQYTGTPRLNLQHSKPGIGINRRGRRLHFLHTATSDLDGVQLGRYVVRFESGPPEEIPIIMGRNIGTWDSISGIQSRAGEAEIAWQGVPEGLFHLGLHGRLFRLAWDNPRPDDPIVSVDVECLKRADHFRPRNLIHLLAITVQDEPPIHIVRQPQSQTVTAGSQAHFKAEPISDTPLTYQWQFNGTNLPSATNSTLSLAHAHRGDAGSYTVEVKNCLAAPVAIVTSSPAVLAVGEDELIHGRLRREVFTMLPGDRLSALTNEVRFPAQPDLVDFVPAFEIPSNNATNFGVRLTGYLVPPETGDYRFYLNSDDEGVLFLSTDASPGNRRVIAHEPEWSGARLWTSHRRRPGRKNISAPIPLESGRHYYVEAWMKQGSGPANLAVAWQLADTPPPANLSPPIPGTHLAVRAEWMIAPP